MNGTVIQVPYRPDYDRLCGRLRIHEELLEEFSEVYGACARRAAPTAAFSLQDVVIEEDDTRIGGVRFGSRVMNRNFRETGISRAIVYAVTCGRELYELSVAAEDPLQRWWIDAISEDAMRAADAEMTRVLKRRYHLGHTARLNPGSFADFPIDDQEGLFQILKEETEQMRLELTPSFLMIPHKSLSGIVYETEADFENCMLCPIEKCPTRRAEYDGGKGKIL